MENKKSKNKLLILVGVFVLLIIIVKVFSPVHNQETVSINSDQVEEKQAPKTENNHSAIIMSGAYQPYTATGFPKLFDQVGEDGLKAIYEHDKKAAKLVSELNECDMVETAAYSESMSIYPTKIVSFVDCKNGNRYYVSNDEISKRS
ncbi:hypothetical protein LVY74_02020 [Acinetobacter sp. ME22]|uniref:hypothetical protein n=1 Tax=Acinetobacter sp. ME22 TaxID=2904802 RepID=UPI001EDBD804|nr:hypothetical protein [Acinetobacter sp. ME22]MCG2572333.1 hypothetical protein [Acinetobacter sp. ME22]